MPSPPRTARLFAPACASDSQTRDTVLGVKALGKLRSSGKTMWMKRFSFCLKRENKKTYITASPWPDGRTADGLKLMLVQTHACAILVHGSVKPASFTSFIPSLRNSSETSSPARP